jgi:hypothetical protein
VVLASHNRTRRVRLFGSRHVSSKRAASISAKLRAGQETVKDTLKVGQVALRTREHAIEKTFELGKGKSGSISTKCAATTPWYRHITLTMLAQAFLVVTRAKLLASPDADDGS